MIILYFIRNKILELGGAALALWLLNLFCQWVGLNTIDSIFHYILLVMFVAGGILAVILFIQWNWGLAKKQARKKNGK